MNDNAKRTLGIAAAALLVLAIAFWGRGSLRSRKGAGSTAQPAAGGTTAQRPGGPEIKVFNLAEVPAEELRALIEHEGRKIETVLDEFFALPEKERLARLDRQLDEEQKLRRSPPSKLGPPPEGAPIPFSPQDHLDATSPEQRAKEQEYFRLLRQRRQDRGLPDDGSNLIMMPRP